MNRELLIALLFIAGALIFVFIVPQSVKAPLFETSNKAGFSYEIDSRRFDEVPNNAAVEQGWTNQNDIMVLVRPKSTGIRPFYIDAFEATISNYRAWSVPGQKPTDKLRYSDAHVACEAAGKRLCYINEWQTACRGGVTRPLRFKNPDYFMQNCDFARSNTYDKNDYVNPTDSHPNCTVPGLPLYHMVGNLSEFVQNTDGRIMIVGLTYYDGKIENKSLALQQACERVVASPGQYPEERYNKGLGFRCCRDIER